MDFNFIDIYNDDNIENESSNSIDQLLSLEIEPFNQNYFLMSQDYPSSDDRSNSFCVVPLPEYQPKLTKKEDENNEDSNVEIKREIKCYKCEKICNIEEMFIYNIPIENKDHFICFDCSCYVNESRALKDWENIPLSNEVKKCNRCMKFKSDNRFTNRNRYCNFCLLKKKWSRIRQLRKNDNEKKPNKEREMRNICSICLKEKELKDMFVYNSDVESKLEYVCVNCSVNLEVCRLHDWENKRDRRNGKLCQRCKKWKTKTRFNKNGEACHYCSLKRRRLYLVSKIKNGIY